MSTSFLFKSFVILTAVAAPTLSLWAPGRTTISLSGTWQIEDSKEAGAIPVAWNHKVAVPGLAHSAEPAFPQVDQFDSRMLIQNRVGQGRLPKTPSSTTQACHPEFRDYAPLGVYLSFWQPSVEFASLQSLRIMLVNDEDREVEGTLTVALENSKGKRVASHMEKFTIAPLGQNTIYNDFKFPSTTGDFLLRAIIEYRANGGGMSSQSRRHVKVIAATGREN